MNLSPVGGHTYWLNLFNAMGDDVTFSAGRDPHGGPCYAIYGKSIFNANGPLLIMRDLVFSIKQGHVIMTYYYAKGVNRTKTLMASSCQVELKLINIKPNSSLSCSNLVVKPSLSLSHLS